MIRAADALQAIGTLPVRPVDQAFGLCPLLVLAPHPDDESLGCGGLIAACCAAGQPPLVVIVTDGAGSHPNSRAYPPDRLRAVRRDEARVAVAALGLPADRILFMGLPDTASPLDGPALAAAAARLSGVIRRHGIRTVLATWEHDPHCDHLSAHRMAVLTCADTGAVHRAYPVWGLTLGPETLLAGTTPTGVRFDIAAYLPAKRRAIAAHRSQYAGLITDDPGSFQMTAQFMKRFDAPAETILDV